MNKELNAEGVKSVAFCPGFVDTDMSDFIKESVDAAEMMRPEDIAEGVRFMLRLSPACIVPEIVFPAARGEPVKDAVDARAIAELRAIAAEARESIDAVVAGNAAAGRNVIGISSAVPPLSTPNTSGRRPKNSRRCFRRPPLAARSMR